MLSLMRLGVLDYLVMWLHHPRVKPNERTPIVANLADDRSYNDTMHM